MRTKTEIENINGHAVVVSETPWTAEDYDVAIQDLEATITPRRLRDAVLTEEGAAWLAAAEAEIAALRAERNAS